MNPDLTVIVQMMEKFSESRLELYRDKNGVWFSNFVKSDGTKIVGNPAGNGFAENALYSLATQLRTL